MDLDAELEVGGEKREADPEPIVPDSKIITLVTKDGEEFKVNYDTTFALSALVKGAFEDDASSDRLPVAQDSAPIRKVVEYIAHWTAIGAKPEKIEDPLKSKKMSECTDEWSAQFVDFLGDKDLDLLYDVILAANYMGMEDLLNLGCAKLGAMIKNEPLDKIADILTPKMESPTKKTRQVTVKEEEQNDDDEEVKAEQMEQARRFRVKEEEKKEEKMQEE